MPLELFTHFSFRIPVSPLLIFAITALIIAGWLVFTVIIRYHWKNYGTGGVEIFTMNFFYLAGSIVLGGLMILSALAYFTSAQ